MVTFPCIPYGQVIDGPGGYRMSMEWYHSQGCCPGPSVSSTGLRKIVLESPHAFWKTWGGNPDRYPSKPDSDSLILGKAAHSLILGDEVFDEHFAYVPADAPRRPSETAFRERAHFGYWKAKDKKAGQWWEAFDKSSNGKLLLDEKDVRTITYMAENLAANPLAVEVLTSEMIEISMIWQDVATGIWVKSRPDCMPTNGFDFGDLKTFSPKGKDLKLSVMRSITDFGYHMQMALAIMAAEEVLGSTAQRCALVFCQTTEPYEVIPVTLDEEALHWGRVLCRKALDTMSECLKAGDWPGAGANMLNYEFPPSFLNRFGEMQAAGELPKLDR